jgi:hypothetical protein
MNFLAAEGSYGQTSVDAAVDIAQRSVPLFEQAIATTN